MSLSYKENVLLKNMSTHGLNVRWLEDFDFLSNFKGLEPLNPKMRAKDVIMKMQAMKLKDFNDNSKVKMN